MSLVQKYGYFPLRIPKHIHIKGLRLDGDVKVYRLGPRGGVEDFEGVYRLREIPDSFPNAVPMERGYLGSKGWEPHPDNFSDATWRYMINYPKSPKNDFIRRLHGLIHKQAIKDTKENIHFIKPSEDEKQ